MQLRLRNVEGKRGKKLVLFLPWEFQTPLSLGTPRLLIKLPRKWLSHKVVGRDSWRQWALGGGTASFLVTCRQVEGGNRILEVRDPLFHWSIKHWGPGRTLETRTPGAQVQALRSTGSPGHILTLNCPFTFSQPLHMTTAHQHQKTVQQIMKN